MNPTVLPAPCRPLQSSGTIHMEHRRLSVPLQRCFLLDDSLGSWRNVSTPLRGLTQFHSLLLWTGAEKSDRLNREKPRGVKQEGRSRLNTDLGVEVTKRTFILFYLLIMAERWCFLLTFKHLPVNKRTSLKAMFSEYIICWFKSQKYLITSFFLCIHSWPENKIRAEGESGVISNRHGSTSSARPQAAASFTTNY